MNCWRVSALAAALVFASVSPTLANLVTDPGFESCTMFSQSPPPGWSGTGFCDQNSHSGSWDGGMLSAMLSQSIATTPGGTYDFSFWLLSGPVSASNSFTAAFGSDQVLNVVNSGFIPYTFYDFKVPATALMTTIQFTGITSGGIWAIDDVSVTQVETAVPEPATLLLATGLFGAAAIRRRRPS
ncbi:MAG TPA: PEP-CTERM sorting domain-containing protein [Steroidobacteraceae bacterium]|nr:PEP-CTERM sorting domain-containing protein [Steroidobacteraceae bacterium]